MYMVCKRFDFAASHKLNGLPEGHPCGNMHGHNYSVWVELQSGITLDETGFVYDYRSLGSLKQALNERFDHKHLNDVMVDNPTAENIAYHIYCMALDFIPSHINLVAVRVSETEKTWAEYRP